MPGLSHQLALERAIEEAAFSMARLTLNPNPRYHVQTALIDDTDGGFLMEKSCSVSTDSTLPLPTLTFAS
jgi:hypothetical protein